MEHTSDTDKRLTELEIKVGFMEDLVDELNTIVVEQRQQIDLLVREVKALRMQAPNEATPVFHSLRDELPPHY
ncbi:SlyX family protein [Aquabacterium sp.]|uniref:SlyX family protein n=1 Tax=Aquabacterium sp. TaxID=1872578 RepID=UPI0035AE4EAD